MPDDFGLELRELGDAGLLRTRQHLRTVELVLVMMQPLADKVPALPHNFMLTFMRFTSESRRVLAAAKSLCARSAITLKHVHAFAN